MTALRGHVRIELQTENLERVLQSVTDAPTGSDVTIYVPARSWPPLYGIQWVADHGGHLGTITIESADPGTVRRWLNDLKTAQTRPTARLDPEHWTRWLDWVPDQKEVLAA